MSVASVVPLHRALLPLDVVLAASRWAPIPGTSPGVVLLVTLSDGRRTVEEVIARSGLADAHEILTDLAREGTLAVRVSGDAWSVPDRRHRRHAFQPLRSYVFTLPTHPGFRPAVRPAAEPAPRPVNAARASSSPRRVTVESAKPTPTPTPTDFVKLAIAAEHNGNLTAALWCVEQALAISPSAADLHARRAHLARKLRNEPSRP